MRYLILAIHAVVVVDDSTRARHSHLAGVTSLVISHPIRACELSENDSTELEVQFKLLEILVGAATATYHCLLAAFASIYRTACSWRRLLGVRARGRTPGALAGDDPIPCQGSSSSCE